MIRLSQRSSARHRNRAYAGGRHVVRWNQLEQLESRFALDGVFFDLEVAAATGVGPWNFTSLGQGPSINDAGRVAFVGASQNASEVPADNLYVFDPTATEDTSRLMNQVFMYPNAGADAGTAASQGIFGEVQINNDNLVLARRRLNAVVQVGFPFGSILTAPLTYLETWDAEAANPPGLPASQVAMGDGGAGPSGPLLFFINPVSGGTLPSPFVINSDFAGLFRWASMNNHGQTAFGTIMSAANGGGNALVTAPHGAPNFFGTATPGYNAQPVIADTGDVVLRAGNEQQDIVKFNFNLGNQQAIAGASSGFTRLGRPSISDDGQVISFIAEHAIYGQGLYASVYDSNLSQFASATRIIGIPTAANGILELGETLEVEGVNLVDRGGFTNFDFSDRAPVNNWAGVGSDSYVMAFKGTLFGESAGIHTVVIEKSRLLDELPEPARDLITLARLGDTDEVIANEDLGLSGAVSELRIHDGVNALGQVAFWMKTTADEQAIIKASPTLREPLLCHSPCEGPDRIDRWWATAGIDTEMVVNLSIQIPSKGGWELSFPAGWNLASNIARLSGTGPDEERTASATMLPGGIPAYSLSLSGIEAGYYSIRLRFAVPAEPGVTAMTFRASASEFQSSTLDTYFIADHPEADFAANPLKIRPKGANTDELIDVTDPLLLAQIFRPILHFDDGTGASGGAERFQMPFNTLSTFDLGRTLKVTGDRNASFDLTPNQGHWGCCPGAQFTPESAVSLIFAPPTIYASVVACPSAGIECGENRAGEPIEAGLAINYFLHYPISNWAEHGGRNSHGGDWEGVTVFLKRNGNAYEPSEVAFSQHTRLGFGFLDDGGDYVSWENAQLNESVRPHVYVGLGGHASYPNAGQESVGGKIEFHYGKASTFSASADQVSYLPRVPNPITPDWLRYPGTWGDPNDGTPFPLSSSGDDGIPGPAFIASGFDPGTRWLNPWFWASEFDEGDAVDAVAGDTNGDGRVDVSDLNNVRNNFGSEGLGDTNGDGRVDIVDLNAVRNNFGTSQASPELRDEPSFGLKLPAKKEASRFSRDAEAVDEVHAANATSWLRWNESLESNDSFNTSLARRRLRVSRLGR